jgi:hypothetical protein
MVRGNVTRGTTAISWLLAVALIALLGSFLTAAPVAWPNGASRASSELVRTPSEDRQPDAPPASGTLADDDDDDNDDDDVLSHVHHAPQVAPGRPVGDWTDYVHFALIDHVADPELPPPRG